MRLLSRVSTIGVLGVMIAGCSSGFERFDHYYQSALPQQPQQANNQYPGSVDPTTTASTRGAPKPLGNVAPVADPQGVYHQPEPTYAQRTSAPVNAGQPVYNAPQTYQQQVYQPQPYQTQSRQPLNTYRPQPVASRAAQSGIAVSALPPAKPTVQAAPQYAPPQPDAGAKQVYIGPRKA
ncbi:MAG: hypothetical protein AAF412_13190, partial [Pseudomonadota bacterium]